MLLEKSTECGTVTCGVCGNVTSYALPVLVEERTRSSALKDEAKCVQLILWGTELELQGGSSCFDINRKFLNICVGPLTQEASGIHKRAEENVKLSKYGGSFSYCTILFVFSHFRGTPVT